MPCHAVMDSQLGVFFDVHPPPRKKAWTCEGDVSGRLVHLLRANLLLLLKQASELFLSLCTLIKGDKTLERGHRLS